MGGILIFGGSFNPIHKGHVQTAVRAADYVSADRIILIPSKIPPHKSDSEYASGTDRYNMCKIAARYDKRMQVSDIELNLDGISYTVRTLEILKKRFFTEKLYFLVGADMLLCFDKWKEPHRILELATLVAVPRDDAQAETLRRYKAEKFKDGNILIIDCDRIDISSTDIRKGIKNGDTAVADMLPDGVYEYIKKSGIYGLSQG